MPSSRSGGCGASGARWSSSTSTGPTVIPGTSEALSGRARCSRGRSCPSSRCGSPPRACSATAWRGRFTRSTRTSTPARGGRGSPRSLSPAPATRCSPTTPPPQSSPGGSSATQRRRSRSCRTARTSASIRAGGTARRSGGCSRHSEQRLRLPHVRRAAPLQGHRPPAGGVLLGLAARRRAARRRRTSEGRVRPLGGRGCCGDGREDQAADSSSSRTSACGSCSRPATRWSSHEATGVRQARSCWRARSGCRSSRPIRRRTRS